MLDRGKLRLHKVRVDKARAVLRRPLRIQMVLCLSSS
jgi:hypothetical protein